MEGTQRQTCSLDHPHLNEDKSWTKWSHSLHRTVRPKAYLEALPAAQYAAWWCEGGAEQRGSSWIGMGTTYIPYGLGMRENYSMDLACLTCGHTTPL